MPETECEFKEWCEILTGQTFCTQEEYEKMGKDYCEDIERFRRLRDHIKKQYAKLPENGKNPYHCYICQPVAGTEEQMAELEKNELHTCNRKAYAEGQQNPDPKQYANREELVEAVHNTWGTKIKYADEIAEDNSTL
ncbi:MAG: hypothetical protein ACXADO_00840, partial [Candidatus Thorarchaeota archaeon]